MLQIHLLLWCQTTLCTLVVPRIPQTPTSSPEREQEYRTHNPHPSLSIQALQNSLGFKTRLCSTLPRPKMKIRKTTSLLRAVSYPPRLPELLPRIDLISLAQSRLVLICSYISPILRELLLYMYVTFPVLRKACRLHHRINMPPFHPLL